MTSCSGTFDWIYLLGPSVALNTSCVVSDTPIEHLQQEDWPWDFMTDFFWKTHHPNSHSTSWMVWDVFECREKSIMKYKVPLHSGRHASCVGKNSLPGLAWSWWSTESRVQTPDKHSYHWSKIEGKLLSYIVLKDYWGPIAGEGVCLSFDKLLRNWCKGLGICWEKEPNFLPDAKIIGVQLAKRIGSTFYAHLEESKK